MSLGQAYWVLGQGDAADRHVAWGLELIQERPPSASKAKVLVENARVIMLTADQETAIRIGREALDLAGRFERHDIRAEALNTIGTSRFMLGDIGGLADLENSVAIAREIRAPTIIHRALNNLMDCRLRLGELEECSQLLEEAIRSNEQFGYEDGLRWNHGEQIFLLELLGDWRQAQAFADDFAAWIEEAGHSHYHECTCRMTSARLARARGDLQQAERESARALELARQTLDLQIMVPALVGRARFDLALGRNDEANAQADEVTLIRGGPGHPVSVAIAWLFADLGRASEIQEALSTSADAPWVQAARSIAAGDDEGAADILGEIRALGLEAHARLRAAESLVADGRRAEADAQLQPALAFFRSVGATAYVREGEALLATSA